MPMATMNERLWNWQSIEERIANNKVQRTFSLLSAAWNLVYLVRRSSTLSNEEVVVMKMRGWMALVVLGCAASACAEDDTTPGTPDVNKVSTARGALNSDVHGPVARGHQLVTMKAVTYLARRGLLAPVLAQNQWYGVPFD